MCLCLFVLVEYTIAIEKPSFVVAKTTTLSSIDECKKIG
jgi:hypothetical protein